MSCRSSTGIDGLVEGVSEVDGATETLSDGAGAEELSDGATETLSDGAGAEELGEVLQLGGAQGESGGDTASA